MSAMPKPKVVQGPGSQKRAIADKGAKLPPGVLNLQVCKMVSKAVWEGKETFEAQTDISPRMRVALGEAARSQIAPGLYGFTDAMFYLFNPWTAAALLRRGLFKIFQICSCKRSCSCPRVAVLTTSGLATSNIYPSVEIFLSEWE